MITDAEMTDEELRRVCEQWAASNLEGRAFYRGHKHPTIDALMAFVRMREKAGWASLAMKAKHHLSCLEMRTTSSLADDIKDMMDWLRAEAESGERI